MFREIFLIFSLFIISAVVLMTPLAAQSDPTDPEEIARMKFGHQKVEGVVIDMKSGLYTVKTSTGATLTLAETAAVRHGQSAPKVGDEMTLWVNEGNMVMDVRPKGHPDKAPRFISGMLSSIDRQVPADVIDVGRGEDFSPQTREPHVQRYRSRHPGHDRSE